LANPISIPAEIAVGVGVGTAVSDIIEPKLRSFRNEQSAAHPHNPPDVMALADGVAKGHIDLDIAQVWADQNGFGDLQFDALIKIAHAGPGTAYAFELWRRGKIGETAFRRALRRAALEDEWIDALVEVKQQILSPAELAVMVQRGIVPDPGYLPVGPPSGRGKVPPMPVANIHTADEAAGSGFNFERMAALTRIIGLPASPDLAARMVFRGIIDRVDFDRAVAEGNTRNEWRDPLFEGFRQIPTAHDGIEGRLRGWIDDAAMYAETARHGMTKADTDLLFKVTGRPLSWHQVFIGLRRGGVYDGPTDHIDPAFLKALLESNIRPEWYNLAWAQRYTYPSPFVMRALTEDRTLTAAQAEADLLDMGWRPDRAKEAATHWAGGAGSSGDPNTRKAQTQLWTRLHRSYIAGETDTNEAKDVLAQLGVEAGAQDEILALWLVERSLAVKQLTAAQVKKAWRNAVTNPATGAPWTREDATTRLIQMGYTYNDAATFLDE
jgi:hypothetical protein